MEPFETRQLAVIRKIFDAEAREASGETPKDPYRTRQIFRFIKDSSSRERLMDEIVFAADWFEHENVMGRDPRGESDFEAIRLAPLYGECYEALSEEAKVSLARFFTERDYSSIYGSENHALMYHTARYLAAQFYEEHEPSRLFMNFGKKTPAEMLACDSAYINEFLDFRAGRAWGEFDSFGYAAEIMLILATLHTYIKDTVLKKKTAMMMDMILLDMICDSHNGLYGGAHGRIYPDAALNTAHSGMFAIYCYYFGERYDADYACRIPAMLALSDYLPGKAVYAVESGRTYPYTNRERKHLHSVSSWNREQVNHENLAHLENAFISKQTYVSPRYMLGGINRQDPYPLDLIEDMGYAHHQQHEWELTLYGATNHKIFTHHPGDPGYHKIHNRWTGDHGCLCSTHYTNEDTAISIYTITKPTEYPYINAYVPLDAFERVIYEDNYLFMQYPGLYISLYFSAGYRINREDEYAGCEVLSDGREHAVVLRVAEAELYDSLEAFAEKIKTIPVVYDKAARTVDFDGIHVGYGVNAENGVENEYPYDLYDNPYVQSKWRSGILHVTDGSKRYVYDFNTVTVTEEE